MKRNNSIVFLLIILLAFVMLSGCGEKKQKNDENMGKTEPIVQTEQIEPIATMEYVMDYYDLTEEDFKGIAVDEVLKYDPLTEEDVREIRKENIIYYFKITQEQMETEIEDAKYDLSYLVEAPEREGKNHPMNKVKYITYFANIAEGGFSYLYDFENGIIYYCVGGRGIYKDYRDASETFVLTDELRENVMQALKEAKVNDWKYFYQEYENGEPVYDSEFYWEFGLEYEDGVVISRSGWGEVPETFGIITSVLESVVPPIEY